MKRLWLDLETYSEVPIKNGAHAYAEGAEILLWAFAIDDGDVQVWDLTTGAPMPAALSDALADQSVLIYAHNSAFDRTVMRHNDYDIPVERWRDTMVKALAHSLPGALGQLCEVLRIPTDQAKDKAGKQLIQLFCKPQPKNRKLRRATRTSHPIEWQRFIDYAGLDIASMRAIDAKLPNWNYRNDELRLWWLDQHINDFGLMVDTVLAQSAITAIDRAKKKLADRTEELTEGGVQSATQRDKLLAHLLSFYGVELPDLQKSTLERRVNDPDLPEELRELLRIRLDASTTATSKYKTLIRSVSSDGRLRGTLQFDGASRTGRWGGRLFQPQNLPRPSLKSEQIDDGIKYIKDDCADLVVDDVIALASSAVRGCIVAPTGKKLVVADLSNIEGRTVAWLAGEDWKLKSFREFDGGVGEDLYKVAYASAFGIEASDVDKQQRQIGKVMELMLGYGGGVGAFLTGAATYRIDLDEMADTALPGIPADVIAESERYYQYCMEKEGGRGTHGLSKRTFLACDSLKRLWRRTHPHIEALWKNLEANARSAIERPGVTFGHGIKVRRDNAWLRIKLPSGRFLCYPSPRISNDGKITYMGINQYSRKWCRLNTYGGKLAENVTQAVARDVLATAMPHIQKAGYQIVLTVHDEIIAEADDTDEFNVDELSALMATNPTWAAGLPLAAAGFETYRYKKDD